MNTNEGIDRGESPLHSADIFRHHRSSSLTIHSLDHLSSLLTLAHSCRRMHVEFMKNDYTFLSLKKFKIPDIFDLKSRIFPKKTYRFIKGRVFFSPLGPIGNTNRCLQCPHWSYNQTRGQVDMIEY